MIVTKLFFSDGFFNFLPLEIIQRYFDTHVLNGCPAIGSIKPILKVGPFGSIVSVATFNAFHNEKSVMRIIKEYGKALTIPMVRIAIRLFSPPATSRAVAVVPSINAQNTLCTGGGSGMPLAERQSITRDPESDDVTK